MTALPGRARRPQILAAAVAFSVAALQFVTAVPAHAAVAATSPSVTEPGDAG